MSQLDGNRAALFLVALGVATTGCLIEERAPVDDLGDQVTIIRDTFGVPHIYAPTDAGVLFGAAWAQAEDNWWQVEDNFVRSLGRASELYGEEEFLDDYLARALEIERRSIEEYERSPEALRSLYDAYAAGFNAYLARHPDVERRLLDRIEPWYTLALIRFKYHHNEYIGYAGLQRDGTELLLAEPDYGPAGEPPTGSNQMAIAGSRTRSGYPMLLINPHVPFFGLSQYWEVHLESDEGLRFSGLSRYGFILPYMGNSDVLGWAYTDNYSDIGDVYIEQFDDPDDPLAYRYGDGYRQATEWQEIIVVREDGGRPEARDVTLRKTHHGPILGLDEDGRPLAVRLARLDEGGWFHQWYEMMRARSLSEWKTAMAMVNVAYMNTLYADRDGNIYYVYNAAIPRRSPDYDWREPVDGSDPGTEWDGYHTLDELPQVLNPPSGFLQNCNSTPLEVTEGLTLERDRFAPYVIGRETQNRRAQSAMRLLAGLEDATLDDFAAAVLESRLIAAETMLPPLVAELARVEREDSERAARLREPVRLLSEWDHEARVDSEATTLFVMWAIRESDPDLSTLEAVLDRLEDNWGTWRVAWGEINRAQRPDASGRLPFDDDLPSVAVPGAPGFLGSVFVYHTRPAPEGRRRYGVHGNSFVKVIEFGPELEARSILTFGQSGDPESPHYFDQAPIYGARSFKPAWHSREDVEAHAARTYSLGPE